MIKLPETLQEVFDVVSVKALEQGEKCFDKEQNICKYRLGEKRCFVGFIIPDEQYDTNLEGFDFSSLVADELIEDRYTFEIDKLQSIHDSGSIEPKDWELHLRDYAKKFKLSTDKMDAYLSSKLE